MTDTLTQEQSFNYVNLSEVDPNARPLIPAGVYEFRVAKAEIKTYNKADGSGTFDKLSLRLVIQNHPDLAGKAFFEGFFPGETTFKHIRRLADVTGVVVPNTQGIADLLTAFSTEQPSFVGELKIMPNVKKDGTPLALKADGVTPEDKNVLNWYGIRPVVN